MPSPSGYTLSFYSLLTGVKPVDSLLSGTYWLGSNWTVGGPTNLSYSFISGSNSYFATNYSADNEYLAMYQLSTDQRGGIIRALSTWSAVANIKFTQTTDDISNVGDLRFGGYALMEDQAAAWAYTPSNTPKGGDVWIGDPANEFPINGSYDYMTYIHEIGHAIGLKHPFSPNSLNSTILDPSLDDVRFTVMSYNNNYSYQPTTPMLLDILAIQALYGANTQWQSGDNVYRWEQYQKVFETIWDSGGTDTIDASNQLNSVNLDLNEGAFSSIGVYFDNNTSGTTYLFNSGLAIAYGTKIENAIGSTFNDILKGNGLDNVLDGREGADTMYGGAGNDTYYVDNTNDVVVETGTSATEIDSVFSTVSYNLGFSPNVENLTLLTNGNLNGTGNASNNVITGNSGNNVLDGGAGADTLIGGAGNDTYIVDNVNDVVIETSTLASEIDTVRSSASFMLGANLENLILTGNASVNAIGNAQNNVLTGNDGDNQLNGGLGLDTMIGGKGNDAYAVDQAGELALVVENANEGNDTLHVIYNATAQDNVVDLRVNNLQNVENVLLLGTGAFSAIGNDLNNALSGNGSSNTLDGGLGNDTLDGGAGADTMIGGLGNDTYVVDDVADSVVEAANEGIDLVQSYIGYTLGTNIENGQLIGNAQVDLSGNDLNNLLTGNANANILNGMAGADTMDGGAGNDTYYVDNVGDVVIERGTSASEIDTVAASIDYTLGANLEYLTLLGSANLNGTGNILNNLIQGNAGDNTLDGGAGGDYLAGGTGNDTYLVDNVGDVVVETSTLVSEIDTVRSSVTFTLGANLEKLTLVGTNTGPINAFGNSQNNVLTGNDADNQLSGGGGLDTMIGGKGDDAYILDQSGELALIQENVGEGKDSLYVIYNATAQDYVVDLGLSNLQNVEDVLIQGSGAFSVIGNALNNGMVGNNDNNLLDGGLGADFMVGGAGNDTYIVDNIGDVVLETSTLASEIDTVRSSVTYVLGANLENLTLTGTANINGVGNAQNNVLIGNDGDNQLNGGLGLDTLIGGKGNDAYGIDQVGELSLVQENANEGTDTLYIGYNAADPRFFGSSVDLTGNLQNVENIILQGSGAFNLTGNSLNNALTGNADNNTLDGGTGADTLDGGAGNDTYIVDNVGDVVIERGTSASEIDTVNSTISYTLGANVENLNLLGVGDINGTGNALNNRITGNYEDNILDGGAGADFMAGGRGDDTYIVDNIGDVISETSEVNFEIDSVFASVTYTLSANLENLTLTGTANINAIGNNRNNVLIGNDGSNQLNGGLGLDTMSGGKGDDAYAVDQAGELALIQENAGEGKDSLYVIFDATAQDHVVDLSLSNLQNVEDVLLLSNGAFNLTGNSLNNTLTGNADNNVLDGGTGADTLDGGAGNDTYIVDNVGDVVIERGTSTSEIDTVAASIDYTLGTNLEYLTLLGSANLNGTGNALNNVILGNAGNNILDGGAGADTLTGGAGNDTYIVDNVGDVVVETSTLASEIDTVRSSLTYVLGANLENLTLTGTANINGVGNAQNNVLIGNDGSNQLNGGLGLDTMSGGKGDDAYAVDQAGELALIQENAGEGKDSLYVIFDATAQDHVVDLSLSNLQNVEDVLLLSNGAFNLIGNSLNNTLTGNASNNVLNGGAGTDTLTGGSGADKFVFSNVSEMGTGANRDVITDFSSLQGDKIDLSQFDANLTLNGFNGFTFIGAGDFTGAGQVRFVDHVLSGNVSGNAGADFEIQLVGVNTFSANDLVA
jgi:serralysin